MALENDKFESIQKLLDATKKEEEKNANELAAYKLRLEKEILEEIKKKQKDDVYWLEKEIKDLKQAGVKLTSKQEQQLMRRALDKENLARKKAQAEYWKTQSKEYEKQKKKEEKDANKELKIAKLRSQKDEEGNEKSFFQKFKDNLKAGFLDTSSTNNKLLDDTFKKLTQSLDKLGNAVNNAMSTYANYQTGINARLQATGKSFASIEKNLGKVAFSPLLKSETLYSNLAQLVQEGIVSNIEQRAFLMTIKDNIATTFDANNTSIKRIIRVQQADSTASRLGMEAFLTRYMNKMVENTEYLTTTFDNVQSALLEASSLMSMQQSNEFEFQVQKWLSALSGLGLSENTASSLAQALGNLGSGNIESLLGSNMGNLILMSSNRMGTSIGEVLSQGLNSNTTNNLLASIVDFVQDMWANSKDNNVVLSQLSNTFGLTVSDVRSIANMSYSIKQSLYNTELSTQAMYDELGYQFDQMANRMNIATIMDNAFKNFEFQTGATLASNPATYALWKIADFIGSTTSGINIPHATVLGTGVDLNTTVDNLLKLGLVGVSTIKNIPNIANAVKSLGSGASMLSAMGIEEGSTIISRGADISKTKSGFTTSQSSYIVNQNQMINQNQTSYTQSATMMREQQQAEAQQAVGQPEVELKDINETMITKFDSVIQYLQQAINIIGDTGVRIADSSIEGFSNAMKTP